MSASKHDSRIAGNAISILFLLSGITGLSYEVIWFKHFSHVWGSSTLAMASVVGPFLFGLGVGAYLFGCLADRIANPMLWYGACEVGIGLLALLIPSVTDLVWHFSIQYYAIFREAPIWYAMIRCGTTLAVIGPACALMGGTLPLLVRQLTVGASIGKTTGWLYGVNTIGAALGCYLVGFHLLPEFGFFWSNVITAMLNVAIGLTAIGIALRMTPTPQVPPAATLESAKPSPFGKKYSAIEVYLIAALSGCAALILQTVWNRQLSLVLGGSTYAFSAMLFVVLIGIGIGSLLFRMLAAQDSDDASVLVYVALGVVVSTIAGLQLLPFVADCLGLLIPLRANYFSNAMICIASCAIVELPAAVAMGVLFPLLLHVSRRRIAGAGVLVGEIYACNTVGALIGTTGASVWLIPAWGTRAAILVALLIYMLVAIGVFLFSMNRMRARVNAAVSLAIVGLVVGLFAQSENDPCRINSGMFLYGYFARLPKSAEVRFFKEGITSNVLVTQEDGAFAFRVNGKVDGSSLRDMSMQLGLAYVPRFFNPNARNVLVIGFGTGSTSGASLLFPETRVTCCEIEPAVVSASRYFSHVNHGPLKSERLSMIYDDARAYVQGIHEQYDLILSEPSNPWIAGVSNLFTAEFYRIASRKLTPGGIFAQWIQTYHFAEDDYAMIVSTLRDVFPYQRLVRVSDSDTILLGANEPLDRTAEIVSASQRLVDAAPDVQADLNRYFGTSDVASLLLTNLLLDEKGLETLVNGARSSRRNLDSNLQLEFRAAQHLYELRDSKSVGKSILAAVNADWLVEQFGRLGGNDPHLNSLHQLTKLFISAGLERQSVGLVGFGLKHNDDSPELLADQLLLRKSLDPQLLERLLASSGSSAATEADRLGLAYRESGRYADAVAVYDKMSAKFPDAPRIWTLLAISYERLGNRNQAELSLRRALELDPANPYTLGESSRILQGTHLNAEHVEKSE